MSFAPMVAQDSECRLLFIPNEKATPEIIESDLYYDRICNHGFTRENIFICHYTYHRKHHLDRLIEQGKYNV